MELECNLIEKKSESGDIDAQIMLANCYATGVGRNRDIDKAEALLREAIDSDSAAAANNLGALLLFKRPESNQHIEGVRYLRKALARGANTASTNLGIAYLVGRGVATDAEAGFQYLQQSADQGEKLASLLLFSAHELGILGAKKNADLANEYWLQFFRHFERFPSDYFHWYIEKLPKDNILRGIVFSDDQLLAIVDVLKNRESQTRAIHQ